jgi:heat shock protein HtpX
MAVAKRVVLFIAVNILVLLTISVTLNLLGVRPYLSARGIDYRALLVFCAVWGMGGAFISLGLSKVMAKWTMGVKIIDPGTADAGARALVNTVHNLARAAGLPKMPEVGIYDSPEVNAFATGPTRSSALVAVSSGLLRRMGQREMEGVLGHEITHIANGDMVTMTLIQGVINVFVMFFARVFAFALMQFLRRDDERGGSSYLMQYMLTFVLEIALSLLGAIAVAAFSRWREFRADAGGARLAGRENMISALEALQRSSELVDTRQAALATLKIAGKRGGLALLFASHPPLEVRIQRLRGVA